MAKMANSGMCRGPGCDHGTAANATICACCLDRLGPVRKDRIDLARTLGSRDALGRLEAEAMADLIILGPNLSPPKVSGFGRRR